MHPVIFVIILTTLLVNVYSNMHWSKEEENCLNELRLNKESIQELRKQAVLPEGNTDLINYVACYWKKKNNQNADGEINWDKMDDLLLDQFETNFKEHPDLTTLLAGEIVEDAVRKCRNKNIEQNIDHGEAVVKLRNCVMKTMQQTIDNFENLKELSRNLFFELFDF